MATEKNESISTSPSKLDIYTKLLDIAGKYTDIEDTDYLKSGLFGYITESMAMMMRDSSYHKSMLYNESFLNTAIIPQSVYNKAKMFNIDVAKAVPAYATIKIIISKESLEGAMAESKKNKTAEIAKTYGIDASLLNDYFIIDKSNMIVAGEYYFSLEHSILVSKRSNGKGYNAKYILTEKPSTNYQTIKSANLPIILNGSNYEIEARAYQYRTTRIERQMVSTRMLNKIQLFEFEDQYAGARLYYNENSLSDKKEISLLYSNIGNSGNEEVAYYNLNSDHELEIQFKGGSEGFIPAPNSRISIDIYTTKGTRVPSNFTGTAVFKFASDDLLRKYGIVVSFDPTNIIGGSDVPTIEKVKQTIIKQLSTCNTIVTESDLNNYFEILTGLLETINDGKVTFVKRRDDILRRVFNAYVLLRDGLTDDGSTVATSPSFISKCIPTNTVSATFKANRFNGDGNALIYPRIKLFASDQQYHGIDDDVNEKDYYFSPFYIFVSLSPVKKVKYIYNLTDNSSALSSTKDELELSEGKYLNPTSVRVYRNISSNAAAENQYHFEFTFSTNLSETEFAKYNNSLKLSFGGTDIFPPPNGGSGTGEYTYDENSNTGVLLISVEVDSDNEFNFADSGTQIHLRNNSVSLPESGQIKLSFNNGDAIYVSDDDLYLFRNLDEIMLSDISINSKTEENADGKTVNVITGITIYDIPVVHSSFINTDTTNKTKFIKQLFTYISLLKENLEKLETSTFFDLKFYNTYGPSQLYNTSTTNLNLELIVHLNNSDPTLQKEIRSYIRRAVDKSNEDGKIKVSKIISLLGKDETYGQYINYIEFNGLNGTFTQYIDKSKASESNARDYPPEWLNLDADKLRNIEFVVD